MGQNCCSERKVPTKRSSAPPPLVLDFPSGGRSEIEVFYGAVSTKDVPTIVKLLASNAAVKDIEEGMHPWASDPKTVGTLACTQLAILVSSGDNAEKTKDKVRRLGGIPAVVGFLGSDSDDRVHAAAVALSYLTTDNSDNSVECYQAGGLKLLAPHMKSPIDGMRSAAAGTIRNMFQPSLKIRREVMDLGLFVDFVNMVRWDPAREDQEHADLVLESVLNLQDLVEDPASGECVPGFVRAAAAAGLVPRLQQLAAVPDEEIRSAVAELLGKVQQ
mmetsp:Transcript_24997/g.54948  ORF Transcript_24997/g.54948 Transcript_24997/m.54948 type:complete len:274 (-) Transcript_24997:98-919(-)|eukprot:CAMPEP_0204308318 /NCGR_PEP_ID=MMETSP0469-20131031/436_1 /ASSEMBLY_ACC=CAM_ASM_000384 /TAXON_ID=2969 /ORGANISM="Oxyrrhis marina" /LENGTH=273 /DNA_ID=CAMNT_0051287787 /DNA_START=39 /DNA_END=860 /DNA_ORIENTATION=-